MEILFYEHDSDQMGSLSFENFQNLSEQLGLCMSRRDLHRVFDIIDKHKTKRLRLEDLKGVASLVHSGDEQQVEQAPSEEDNLKGLSGAALIKR